MVPYHQHIQYNIPSRSAALRGNILRFYSAVRVVLLAYKSAHVGLLLPLPLSVRQRYAVYPPGLHLAALWMAACIMQASTAVCCCQHLRSATARHALVQDVLQRTAYLAYSPDCWQCCCSCWRSSSTERSGAVLPF